VADISGAGWGSFYIGERRSEGMVADGIIKKFIPVDLGADDVEEQIVAAVNGLADEVRVHDQLPAGNSSRLDEHIRYITYKRKLPSL